MSETPKVKLLVGVPCYGGQMYYTTCAALLATMDAFKQVGWDVVFYFFGNESLVQRARNRIVSHFVATADATHLLFVDSDIGFNPQDLVYMVQAEMDIVAGAYPRKEIVWDRVETAARQGVPTSELKLYASDHVVNLTDDAHAGRPVSFCRMANSLFCEVKDAGTGFMLIKRAVIEKMIEAHPELEYVPDHGEQYGAKPYALFDCIIEPETKRYLSEDYTFCRRWQKLGGKIYSMVSARLTHTGTHTFYGHAAMHLSLPDFGDLPVEFVDVKTEAA